MGRKKTLIIVMVMMQFALYSCSASNNNAAMDKKENNTEIASKPQVEKESEPQGENLKPVILTVANFDDFISSGIVLIDFWAVWCPPCRIQGPIIEELAKEVNEWASVGKIDVDRVPQIADIYRIQNIPTLLIFKDGRLVKRLVGLQQKQTLIAALKEFK